MRRKKGRAKVKESIDKSFQEDEGFGCFSWCDESKGYRLPKRDELILSRDVVFDERGSWEFEDKAAKVDFIEADKNEDVPGPSSSSSAVPSPLRSSSRTSSS